MTALNLKSIVFLVAFVPQFVEPAAPLLCPCIVLIAAFVALATVNTALWATLAGERQRRLGRPEAMRLVRRAAGGLLVGRGS